MPPLVRRDIWFNSADSVSRVAGYIFTNPSVKPYCVLQISHGMCEHIARYEEFAGVLAAQGIAVCGNDHIGHGATAAEEGDLGYFTEKNGRQYAVNDLRIMNTRIRETFPGLPVILLGHSMGSFFARRYAARWPGTIDGLIISGTGGKNPLAGFGIALTSLLMKLFGPRHRSKLVFYMAFGTYLKRIEKPRTRYDWISRDEKIVDIYAADPLCTFRFTLNGYHELFSALKDVTGPKWAAAIRKNMPILMFSGDADPVGDYGQGVRQVQGWMKAAGATDLSLILYPGGRHEMLNELNRTEVYADVLKFIQNHWGMNPNTPGQGE